MKSKISAPWTGRLSRTGAVRRAPVAAALAIVVPTLAAGVFWAGPAVSGEPSTVTMAPASEQSSSDPLATTRSALAATTLPFSVLGSGVTELTEGGLELDDGARQMKDGLGQAREGSAELADGMTQLRSGLWQLGDGSSQVSGGVDRVVTALTGLGAAQGQIELIVQQTLESLETSTDPVATASADQLRTVLDLLRTQGLNSGVVDELEQLRSGAQTLAFQLDDPSSEFVDGMVRATEGSGELREGLVQLDDGGVLLVDGTTRLVEGTGPMTTFLDGIEGNVTRASSALPAAASVETDPTGSSSTFVVRAAAAPWPYLAAVFVMVAGALVGFVVPRARAVVIAAVAAAASMVVALSFADTGASLGGFMTVTALVAAWTAAVVCAARAVRVLLGVTAAAVVLGVLGLLQLVVVGLAGPAFGDDGGAAVSAFTPLGQLMSALGSAASDGVGVSALVSFVAALATAGVGAVILSAHRSGEEPPNEGDEEPANEESDTAPVDGVGDDDGRELDSETEDGDSTVSVR